MPRRFRLENVSRHKRHITTNAYVSLRNRARDLASTWANWLEQHEWSLLALLAVIYAVSTYVFAAGKLLWHDELFTFWIAQAPTWRELFHLTRTLDWNPPLLYSLARWSMKLLGAGALQLRLPSMLAYAGCAYCIYLSVRRWTGSAVWGFVGLLTFLAQDTGHLASEARPYALTMCFIVCGIYFYMQATEDERAGRRAFPALAALAASGTLCLLSHIFALLPWACLLLVELIHTLRAKRVYLAKWAALLLPLAVTPLYLPLLADHGASAFPVAFQPNWMTAINFYADESSFLSLVLPALAFSVVLIGPEVLGYCKLPKFRLESLLLIAGLLFAPAVLIFYLMHSHGAFWPRYGFCFSLGFALALPAVIFSMVRGNRSVALILILIMLLASKQLLMIASVIHRHRSVRVGVPDVCLACEAAQRLDPSLPFVDASGLDYVEMNARLPASSLPNVYYIYDLALGIQYAHATIFEGMPHEQESFHFQSKVASYDEFTHSHRDFFVYGDVAYPEQWLLRKLLADGATVQLIGYFPDDSYLSKYLWKVELRR